MASTNEPEMPEIPAFSSPSPTLCGIPPEVTINIFEMCDFPTLSALLLASPDHMRLYGTNAYGRNRTSGVIRKIKKRPRRFRALAVAKNNYRTKPRWSRKGRRRAQPMAVRAVKPARLIRSFPRFPPLLAELKILCDQEDRRIQAALAVREKREAVQDTIMVAG